MNLLTQLYGSLCGPWLMCPERVHEFVAGLVLASQNGFPAKASKAVFDDEEPEDDGPQVVDDDFPLELDENGWALLKLRGPLLYDTGYGPWACRWFGITDLKWFAEDLTLALESEQVKGVLVDVNSPGGTATYVREIMEMVGEGRRQKPIEFETRSLMASAAYFIAGMGTSVRATASALVGSIGVFTAHLDMGEYYRKWGIAVDVIKNEEGTHKAAGLMGSSLTKEQRAQKQELVQTVYDEAQALLRGARPALNAEYMNGAVYLGSQAFWKGTGMIDDLLAR